MINWIMTVIGLILLIAYYQLIGSSFFIWINVKRNRFAFNLISGFILTWALGWIIGFPCELFSTSWNFFAILFSIFIIITIVLALFIQFEFNQSKYQQLSVFIKKDYKERLKIIRYHVEQNLKKYWFVYLFVIIFSILSITNLQPYTLNNYNDDHYIVRVLRLYKSPALFNENYYTGNVLQYSGKFSYAMQQGQRMLNTYELNYSYFGSLLHINLIFFCRVTMTIHNYLIVFMLYTLFASIFLDEKYSQYGILCFAILMIPSGYLAKAKLPIRVRMWENWRFQTAMYMGGSIVRVCSFPMMIYYMYLWMSHHYIRNILIYLFIAISLLSFQTTAISYIMLFIPIFIIGMILGFLWKKVDVKNKKEIMKKDIISLMILIGFAVMFFIVNHILGSSKFQIPAKFNFISHLAINAKALNNIAKGYIPYYRDAFVCDFFAKSAIIPLVLLLFLKKRPQERIVTITCIILYFIFASNLYTIFLSLISFESYCTARILTATQLIIVSMYGICIINLLNHINYQRIVTPILCGLLALTPLEYINVNINKILKYSGDGDGIIRTGYSFDPLKNNTQMLAPIFVEVGQYFEKLPGHKYLLYSDERFFINNEEYGYRGFLMGSKKIQNAINYDNYSSKELVDRYKKSNLAYWFLKAYLNKGEKQFYHNDYIVQTYLNNSDLRYLVTTNKDEYQFLVKHKWKLVLGNSKKGYFLLKYLP